VRIGSPPILGLDSFANPLLSRIFFRNALAAVNIWTAGKGGSAAPSVYFSVGD
jgi:hypothetical protein